jgi:DNA-binding transcriptional LysR family regulator
MEQSSISSDDLILFSVIAEQGSLVRAADHLGLPKATVSRRLTLLESRVCQKLMIRTTRRLTLTEFGREFLEHCMRVAEESAEAIDFIKSQETRPRGRLRVSMPNEYGTIFPVTHAIATFVQQYPEVRLEMDFSSRRVDLIGEHFDLAIRMGNLDDSATLVARKIGELHVAPYASPIYLGLNPPPSSPEELMRHNMVRLSSAEGRALPLKLRRDRQDWTGTPSGNVMLNSPGMVQQLVLDGVGIGILPVNVANEYVQLKQLARVLPDWDMPSVSAWAVMPTRKYLPSKTRIFLSHLEEYISSALASV